MGKKNRPFRTLNKTKFQHFFSKINKSNLPFASLCVLGLIPSFWAFFVTTVTTFIRRSLTSSYEGSNRPRPLNKSFAFSRVALI